MHLRSSICKEEKFRGIDAENDAERKHGAQVERETGVALIGALVFLGRLQAVVLVVVGFAAKVGEDAERLAEVIFRDKAGTETEYGVFLTDVLPGVERVGRFPADIVRRLRRAVAGRLGEMERVADSDAGIEARPEGAFDGIVAVEVEGAVEETVHTAEIVRIEAVCGSLARIRGAAVVTVPDGDAEPQGFREFKTDGC